jgi:uncharacterized protein (TIGR00299 family) protein
VTRIGWLDASSGVSGDMLLGACVDAGVPLDLIRDSIRALGLPEPIEVTAAPVLRAGLGATRVEVRVPESPHRRRLPDILALLEPLDDGVRDVAARVFRSLAAAEAKVHRVAPEEVHFHEVGALDSIADVVGVVAAVRSLGLDRLVCSPIAVGAGRASTAHGSLPVPVPAVAELLVGGRVPAYAGPAARELATPTGVALMAELAGGFGPMPAMVPDRIGSGAGTWDPPGHANIVRLLVGQSPDDSDPVLPTGALVLEANVDDLDPRLWPGVIGALMDAGADDAWLTPIVMKKGRPAHTVSVLADPDRADRLTRALLTYSSTIGLRRRPVEKVALPREIATVEVDGSPVRVKLARLDGRVVNLSVEHADVARVARDTGRAEKQVLAAALAAAQGLWPTTAP